MSATYESASELAEALRRAESAHGEYEKEIGHADPDWPTWYAEYMVREQRFKHLPERIDPQDTIATQQTNPARDPEGGRDTDTEFTLRYGAG
jgi:hypothetical protein